MRTNLTILTCGHFQNELEQVLREEEFNDVDLVLFPANCDRPLQNADLLTQKTVCGSCKQVILGGSCIEAVRENLPSRGLEVIPEGECYELFLPAAIARPFAEQGAHLFTPGMLKRWEESYRSWEFSKEEARDFFAESTSKLVLIDTGVDHRAVDNMSQIAAELDLPFETLEMGLDHLRLELHRLVARTRNESTREAESQLADYAMVYDLAGGIAALTDEEQVVERVLELFSMICAPTLVHYLPIIDGNTDRLFSSLPPEDEAAEIDRLAKLQASYEMDEENNGFRIDIRRDGQRLGALAVLGISFSEHTSRYLNLSLTIMPVIALAISNARTFRQRVEAEQQVQQLNRDLKERLITVDALNQELEAFTYSVSHDLRGPLRSLDGFSNILLREYSDKLDDQGQRYLDRLRANAQRMGQLIDDLLRLSRLTRAELTRGTVDLSAVVSDLAQDLSQTAPQRHVDFSIQEGLRANCDPSLVKIVLENLIGNAWKYTSKIDHARIEFGERVDDGKQRFFVRDNGDGFDMTYAEKLFSPFQRLHTEDEFPGTGIGLATVHRIIMRHGGTIRAESEPGRGACFYFTVDS